MIWTFTIPGPLMGYRRPRDHGSNYSQYVRYKDKVRAYARVAGLETEDPQREDAFRWLLSVNVFWRGAARSDWSNVYKAIEDSLFGFDRYVVPGSRSGLLWDLNADKVRDAHDPKLQTHDVAVVTVERIAVPE